MGRLAYAQRDLPQIWLIPPKHLNRLQCRLILSLCAGSSGSPGATHACNVGLSCRRVWAVARNFSRWGGYALLS